MLERALELKASGGPDAVAASAARWWDRSKDHGENNQTRQTCRRARAHAEDRLQDEAGPQAEADQGGSEEADVGVREGEILARQDESGKPREGGKVALLR